MPGSGFSSPPTPSGPGSSRTVRLAGTWPRTADPAVRRSRSGPSTVTFRKPGPGASSLFAAVPRSRRSTPAGLVAFGVRPATRTSKSGSTVQPGPITQTWRWTVRRSASPAATRNRSRMGTSVAGEVTSGPAGRRPCRRGGSPTIPGGSRPARLRCTPPAAAGAHPRRAPRPGWLCHGRQRPPGRSSTISSTRSMRTVVTSYKHSVRTAVPRHRAGGRAGRAAATRRG